MTIKKADFISLLLMALFFFLPVKTAKADLTIAPIRVVFGDSDRSATVELLNITNHTNIYRLTWMETKIDKSGRFALGPVDDTKPYSVAKMVIFAPRQVTIEPHGDQTIRLSLRRPANLPFGEYRAHMVMLRLAKQGPERQDPNDKAATPALNSNLGFSIPIIVRSGEDKDLKVALASPRLAMGGNKEKPTLVLNIDVNRVAGKFSSYGSLEVYWQSPQSQEQLIGGLGNVALYPELQQRHLVIPLRENPTGGKIRVVYKGRYESEGKIWDEKTFPIGN